MPFKLFTAGEEALAADVNTYLSRQVVAVFADAAARTAAMTGTTAPVVGQLTYLTTRGQVLQVWTGSAWVDCTYFNALTVAGNSVVTTDGTSSGAVNFGVTFSGTPYVALTDGAPWGGAASGSVHLSLTAINTTGFGYRARLVNNDTAIPAASVRIIWIAVGVRA